MTESRLNVIGDWQDRAPVELERTLSTEARDTLLCGRCGIVLSRGHRHEIPPILLCYNCGAINER